MLICRPVLDAAATESGTNDNFQAVAKAGSADGASGEKAQRRAARALIAAYHQEQLRMLLELVREGFARLDSGDIDEFELDDLIHRYQRAAGDLWRFCGSTGGQWLQAANTLTYLRERGDEPDWWAQSGRRRSRSTDRD